MKAGCIFCGIAAGSIPADFVYRDSEVVAFRDNHPKAPVHILVVPVQHVESLNATGVGHAQLLGSLLAVARRVAGELGVATTGYRCILNTGPDGGQMVPHLHLHLLGGRHLGPKLVA